VRLQDWWFTSLLAGPEELRPPLRSDLNADVVIVGAGACGLAAALRFLGSGKKVVLLDRNVCGGSSTGKSAGFLTPDSELELSDLLRRFGPEGARDLWEVPSRGIRIMTDAVAKHGIACDLIPQDSLFVSKGADGWKAVAREADARRQLGYPYRLYSEGEVPTVLGSTRYSGAVRYPECFGINALRYAQGVKRALVAGGIDVYESTEVRALHDHTVRTHLGSVTAEQIIVCADKPTPAFSPYVRNVYHAQTFLSISEPLRESEIHDLFPDRPVQCWDTDLIYTYWRLTGDARLLVGGGSLYSTYARNDTTGPRIVSRVIRRLKELVPAIRPAEFIQYWPGRIDMTRDLLPTIVRDPEHPWIHHVLGCVGLPWATFCGDFVAGQLLATDDATVEARKYYRYFRPDRRFPMPVSLETFLGKKVVFTLSNTWAKYYEVDRPPVVSREASPPPK
jgi:gamma-glutamylputrescine oxidase